MTKPGTVSRHLLSYHVGWVIYLTLFPLQRKYDPKLRGSLRASRSRNNVVAGPKATEPKTATISDDDKAREDEESKARARWLADYIMSTKDIYD